MVNNNYRRSLKVHLALEAIKNLLGFVPARVRTAYEKEFKEKIPSFTSHLSSIKKDYTIKNETLFKFMQEVRDFQARIKEFEKAEKRPRMKEVIQCLYEEFEHLEKCIHGIHQ